MIVGIDPGLDGALAFLDASLWSVVDMPIFKIGKHSEYHLALMAQLLEDQSHLDGLSKPESVMVVLEEIGKRPEQSVQSMVTTGYGHGLLRGMIAVLGYQVQIVNPRKWQNAVLGKFGKGEAKDAAWERARQIAPGANLSGPRGRRLYGRSDAICIAYWYDQHGCVGAA